MSFVSFPHRHSFLIPTPMEPPTPIESRRLPDYSGGQDGSRTRLWKRRIGIPDYRKTKIGEYQDENDSSSSDATIGASDTESDNASLNSMESSTTSLMSIETSTDYSTSQTSLGSMHTSQASLASLSASMVAEKPMCSGCNLPFDSAALPASFQLKLPPQHIHNQQQRAPRSPFAQVVTQPSLRCQTGIKQNKFRCMWPGCRVIVCSVCEPLLRMKKEYGGAQGNLELLKEIRVKVNDMAKVPIPMRPKSPGSGLVLRPYGKFKPNPHTLDDDSIPLVPREEEVVLSRSGSVISRTTTTAIKPPVEKPDEVVTAELVEAAAKFKINGDDKFKTEENEEDNYEVVDSFGTLQKKMTQVVNEVSEEPAPATPNVEREVGEVYTTTIPVSVKA